MASLNAEKGYSGRIYTSSTGSKYVSDSGPKAETTSANANRTKGYSGRIYTDKKGNKSVVSGNESKYTYKTKSGETYSFDDDAATWISKRYNSVMQDYYDADEEDQLNKANGAMPRSFQKGYTTKGDKQLYSLGLPSEKYLPSYLGEYYEWRDGGNGGSYYDFDSSDSADMAAFIKSKWKSSWTYGKTTDDLLRQSKGEMPAAQNKAYYNSKTGMTNSWADQYYLDKGLPAASEMDYWVNEWSNYNQGLALKESFYADVGNRVINMTVSKGIANDDKLYDWTDENGVTTKKTGKQIWQDTYTAALAEEQYSTLLNSMPKPEKVTATKEATYATTDDTITAGALALSAQQPVETDPYSYAPSYDEFIKTTQENDTKLRAMTLVEAFTLTDEQKQAFSNAGLDPEKTTFGEYDTYRTEQTDKQYVEGMDFKTSDTFDEFDTQYAHVPVAERFVFLANNGANIGELKEYKKYVEANYDTEELNVDEAYDKAEQIAREKGNEEGQGIGGWIKNLFASDKDSKQESGSQSGSVSPSPSPVAGTTTDVTTQTEDTSVTPTPSPTANAATTTDTTTVPLTGHKFSPTPTATPSAEATEEDAVEKTNDDTGSHSEKEVRDSFYNTAKQNGMSSKIDLYNRPQVSMGDLYAAGYSADYDEEKAALENKISNLEAENANNPSEETEKQIEDAKDELNSLGNSVATVYSMSVSNEDETKTVVYTPILQDGKILSPSEAGKAANDVLKGGEDTKGIVLSVFEGPDSVAQANAFSEQLSAHQEQQLYEYKTDYGDVDPLSEDGIRDNTQAVLDKAEKVFNDTLQNMYSDVTETAEGREWVTASVYNIINGRDPAELGANSKVVINGEYTVVDDSLVYRDGIVNGDTVPDNIVVSTKMLEVAENRNPNVNVDEDGNTVSAANGVKIKSVGEGEGFGSEFVAQDIKSVNPEATVEKPKQYSETRKLDPQYSEAHYVKEGSDLISYYDDYGDLCWVSRDELVNGTAADRFYESDVQAMLDAYDQTYGTDENKSYKPSGEVTLANVNNALDWCIKNRIDPTVADEVFYKLMEDGVTLEDNDETYMDERYDSASGLFVEAKKSNIVTVWDAYRAKYQPYEKSVISSTIDAMHDHYSDGTGYGDYIYHQALRRMGYGWAIDTEDAARAYYCAVGLPADITDSGELAKYNQKLTPELAQKVWDAEDDETKAALINNFSETYVYNSSLYHTDGERVSRVILDLLPRLGVGLYSGALGLAGVATTICGSDAVVKSNVYKNAINTNNKLNVFTYGGADSFGDDAVNVLGHVADELARMYTLGAAGKGVEKILGAGKLSTALTGVAEKMSDATWIQRRAKGAMEFLGNTLGTHFIPMVANATGSNYNQAIAEGADPTKLSTAIYALVTGITEAATESLSFDRFSDVALGSEKLFKQIQSGAKALTRVRATLFKASVAAASCCSEIGEELTSDLVAHCMAKATYDPDNKMTLGEEWETVYMTVLTTLAGMGVSGGTNVQAAVGQYMMDHGISSTIMDVMFADANVSTLNQETIDSLSPTAQLLTDKEMQSACNNVANSQRQANAENEAFDAIIAGYQTKITEAQNNYDTAATALESAEIGTPEYTQAMENFNKASAALNEAVNYANSQEYKQLFKTHEEKISQYKQAAEKSTNAINGHFIAMHNVFSGYLTPFNTIEMTEQAQAERAELNLQISTLLNQQNQSLDDLAQLDQYNARMVELNKQISVGQSSVDHAQDFVKNLEEKIKAGRKDHLSKQKVDEQKAKAAEERKANTEQEQTPGTDKTNDERRAIYEEALGVSILNNGIVDGLSNDPELYQECLQAMRNYVDGKGLNMNIVRELVQRGIQPDEDTRLTILEANGIMEEEDTAAQEAGDNSEQSVAEVEQTVAEGEQNQQAPATENAGGESAPTMADNAAQTIEKDTSDSKLKDFSKAWRKLENGETVVELSKAQQNRCIQFAKAIGANIAFDCTDGNGYHKEGTIHLNVNQIARINGKGLNAKNMPVEMLVFKHEMTHYLRWKIGEQAYDKLVDTMLDFDRGVYGEEQFKKRYNTLSAVLYRDEKARLTDPNAKHPMTDSEFEAYWINNGDAVVRDEYCAMFTAENLFTNQKAIDYFVKNQEKTAGKISLKIQNLIHKKLGVGDDSRSYKVPKAAAKQLTKIEQAYQLAFANAGKKSTDGAREYFEQKAERLANEHPIDVNEEVETTESAEVSEVSEVSEPATEVSEVSSEATTESMPTEEQASVETEQRTQYPSSLGESTRAEVEAKVRDGKAKWVHYTVARNGDPKFFASDEQSNLYAEELGDGRIVILPVSGESLAYDSKLKQNGFLAPNGFLSLYEDTDSENGLIGKDMLENWAVSEPTIVQKKRGTVSGAKTDVYTVVQKGKIGYANNQVTQAADVTENASQAIVGKQDAAVDNGTGVEQATDGTTTVQAEQAEQAAEVSTIDSTTEPQTTETPTTEANPAVSKRAKSSTIDADTFREMARSGAFSREWNGVKFSAKNVQSIANKLIKNSIKNKKDGIAKVFSGPMGYTVTDAYVALFIPNDVGVSFENTVPLSQGMASILSEHTEKANTKSTHVPTVAELKAYISIAKKQGKDGNARLISDYNVSNDMQHPVWVDPEKLMDVLKFTGDSTGFGKNRQNITITYSDSNPYSGVIVRNNGNGAWALVVPMRSYFGNENGDEIDAKPVYLFNELYSPIINNSDLIEEYLDSNPDDMATTESTANVNPPISLNFSYGTYNEETDERTGNEQVSISSYDDYQAFAKEVEAKGGKVLYADAMMGNGTLKAVLDEGDWKHSAALFVIWPKGVDANGNETYYMTAVPQEHSGHLGYGFFDESGYKNAYQSKMPEGVSVTRPAVVAKTESPFGGDSVWYHLVEQGEISPYDANNTAGLTRYDRDYTLDGNGNSFQYNAAVNTQDTVGGNGIDRWEDAIVDIVSKATNSRELESDERRYRDAYEKLSDTISEATGEDLDLVTHSVDEVAEIAKDKVRSAEGNKKSILGRRKKSNGSAEYTVSKIDEAVSNYKAAEAAHSEALNKVRAESTEKASSVLSAIDALRGKDGVKNSDIVAILDENKIEGLSVDTVLNTLGFNGISYSSDTSVSGNGMYSDFVPDDNKYMELAQRYLDGDMSVAAQLRDMVSMAYAHSTNQNDAIDLYHGTRNNFGFTRFEQGHKSGVGVTSDTKGDNFRLYASESKRNAAFYAAMPQFTSDTTDVKDANGGEGIYHLYGNAGDNPLVFDAKGRNYLNLNFHTGDGGILNTTNQVAEYAREHGYTSVKFENIVDGNEFVTANQYAMLNPNQVKSADLVTLDDKGRIIPLSRRFDWSKSDIRYDIGAELTPLTPDMDVGAWMNDNYMRLAQGYKDNSGNEEVLQTLVDAAATRSMKNIVTDNNGEPLNLYHGTARFGFTVFDTNSSLYPHIFTSDNPDVSTVYSHGGGVLSVDKGLNDAAQIEVDKRNSAGQSSWHKATDEDIETFKWQCDNVEKFSGSLARKWAADNASTLKKANVSKFDLEYYLGEDGQSVGKYSLNQIREGILRGLASSFLSKADEKELHSLLDSFDNDVLEQIRYREDGLDIGDREEVSKRLIVSSNGDLVIIGDNSLSRGIYRLYGDLGSNPLVVDAKEAWWSGIDFNGERQSTDEICVWAKANGYTSVQIDNVYDGGKEVGTDYIFFDSNQLKSADPVTYDDKGNVIPLSERFNLENPDIRYDHAHSLSELTPIEDSPYVDPMYYKSAQVVTALNQTKFDAASLTKMLQGKGVKTDEMKWLGLDQWLADKKTVSKGELLQYIKDNQLLMTETTRRQSEPIDYDRAETSVTDLALRAVESSPDADFEKESIGNDASEYYRSYNKFSIMVTELVNGGGYTVDEVTDAYDSLITETYEFGHKYGIPDSFMSSVEEHVGRMLNAAVSNSESSEPASNEKFRNHMTNFGDGMATYREVTFALPNITGDGRTFESSHFGVYNSWGNYGEHNVIGHLLLQDTVAPDGGKVLYCNEVQSDWHEEGREHGYVGPNDIARANDEYDAADEAAEKAYAAVYDFYMYGDLSNAAVPNQDVLRNVVAYIRGDHGRRETRDYNSLSEFGASPETIKEFERLVLEYDAAEERKADAVDNARKVREAVPDAPFKKTWQEMLMKKALRMAAEGGYDYVAWPTGAERSSQYGTEQGMAGFYDRGGQSSLNIPRFMDKYCAQWGASTHLMNLGPEGHQSEGWGVKVTDDMKKSVLYEGQPLFDKGYTFGDMDESWNDEAKKDAQRAMSDLFDNTVRETTKDEGLKEVNNALQAMGCNPAFYDQNKEKASVAIAAKRLNATYENGEDGFTHEIKFLKNKPGNWEGPDTDVAMGILEATRQTAIQTGNAQDYFNWLSIMQKRITAAAQCLQSLAKYTRVGVDAWIVHGLYTAENAWEKSTPRQRSDVNKAKGEGMKATDKARKEGASTSELIEMLKGTFGKMYAEEIAKYYDEFNAGNITEAQLNEAIEGVARRKAGLPAMTIGDVNNMMEYDKESKKHQELYNSLKKQYDESADEAERRKLQKRMDEEDYLRRANISRAAQVISNVAPGTLKEYASSWRRIAMLLNPKTMIKNAAANAVFAPLEWIKDEFATPFDMLMSKRYGTERTTTWQTPETIGAELKGRVEGLKAAVQDVKLGVDTKEGQGVEKYEGTTHGRKVWTAGGKETFVRKTMQKLDNLVAYGLQTGDRPYFNGALENRLTQLEKLGYDMDDPATQQDAISYALDRTFQNNSKLSEAMSAVRRYMNMGMPVGIGDLLLPFVQTPANITSKLLDYGPVGLARAVAQLGSAHKQGTLTTDENGNRVAVSDENHSFDQKLFVDRIGRGLTGTGIMALGMALARAGILIRKPDDEDEREAKKNAGVANYAIKIGDNSYPINWAEPGGTMLLMGAELDDGIDGEDGLINVARTAVLTGINSFFDNSVLQSINNLLSGNESAAENIEDIIIDSSTQFAPSFMKAILNFVDEDERYTYDPDKYTRALNKLKMYVPGLRQTLPVKYGTDGKAEESSYGETGFERFVNSFISPAIVETESDDRVNREIYRLYEEGYNGAILPVAAKTLTINGKSQKLTASDRNSYQRALGKANYAAAKEVMNDPNYKGLSNEEKSELLSDAIKKATDATREEWKEKLSTKKAYK